MEQKRRGRPPGTGKKKNVEEAIKNNLEAEVRKRGRQAQQKLSVDFVPEVSLEGEIEGTVPEKLKNLSQQIKYMDHLLDKEPYRMDVRMKKTETIQRMCFLIDTL
jgi:hypothetical protein